MALYFFTGTSKSLTAFFIHFKWVAGYLVIRSTARGRHSCAACMPSPWARLSLQETHHTLAPWPSPPNFCASYHGLMRARPASPQSMQSLGGWTEEFAAVAAVLFTVGACHGSI